MWEPIAGVNVLTGANGVGKTSLLEAVYVLCMARGFGQDQHLLQSEAEFYLIDGQWQGPERQHRYQLSYQKGQGKKVLRDGNALPRLSDHIGELPVVSLLPEDTDLIREGSSLRRQWLDATLAQTDRPYLEALLRYTRALKQRNALLSQLAQRGTRDDAQLGLWDLQLAEAGQTLVARRSAFFEAFRPSFAQAFASIVSEAGEAPALSYRTGIKDNTPAGWATLLHEAREADHRRGFSTAGAHRDDFRLAVNARQAKYFASQGQKKSLIAALKFAQYHWLNQATGKPPLLLLDDLFDKLDPTRVAALARLLVEAIPGQVFITDTSAERLQAAFAPLGSSAQAFRYWQVGPSQLTELPTNAD